MSLELYSAEVKAIDTLWQAWETKSDYELEATFANLDYTSQINIIKHLRGLGLQEIPQTTKLNILVNGGLRFTIEGDETIQQYCRDNTLKGKPFEVLLKERKVLRDGSSEVDIKEYGVRMKLRHELILKKDDPRVQEVLMKWQSLPKAFRYIKRYSFRSNIHKGIQFDASFVRENKKDMRGSYIQATTFTGAQIQKQEIKYEMEIEALRYEKPSLKSFLIGWASVLRGLQRSYILTRYSTRNDIVKFMAAKTGTVLRTDKGRQMGFPGAKPVTLRKEHMGLDSDAEIANIRTGDYNVTDKADGLRCLLIINPAGRIYLIDPNMTVYGTDRFLEGEDVKIWTGVILDGEWVTQDKENKQISHYYAFDILNGKNGEDVTDLPFLRRGEDEKKPSRHQILSEVIAAISVSNSISIPVHKYKLSIFMKTFRWSSDPTDANGIFKEAATILDRVQRPDAPYHTDGLIFTPNKDPLPKNGKTWPKQFKWKPASMNSIDFLVMTEKERDVEGKSTNVDYIQYEEGPGGNAIRCKTLHLFVGSSEDSAKIDPRDTILHKRPLPTSDRGTVPYRPIEFYVTPADPLASICRIGIHTKTVSGEDSVLALNEDTIVCEETNEPISDRTIVEMVYKPERPAGWRWVPLRVRWDKTQLFARGEIGGTMNDITTATNNWISINDPITEYMIRTGNMVDPSITSEYKPSVYYKRESGQDRYITGGMLDFHNKYIKNQILLSSTLRSGDALLDMSVGRAGDLHKWMAAKVGWVLGCDISLSGLIEKNGAYDRYLTQAIQRKGNVPKMLFVQADSSLRYADGSAGLSTMDSGILRCLWGSDDPGVPPYVKDIAGKGAEGFDVLSSMFALHYLFKSKQTLDGFLQNIAESLKVGGYFIGCCTDGDRVADLLRSNTAGESVSGVEGEKTLWKITKQYEDSHGFLPSDDSCLGRAIDVNFISIGETHTEYLVSFEYLNSRLAEIGIELLNPEELQSVKLKHSTNLFGESYEMAKDQGLAYSIPASLQKFSFLSRWFIFRRRSTQQTVEPVAQSAGEIKNEIVYELIELRDDIDEEEEGEGEGEEEEEEANEDTITLSGGQRIVADGPVFQFYHKSAPKDDLKMGDKHWRRYLSTYASFTYNDLEKPSVEYSSLEAALGSAKFQYGTDKPELGIQIFSKQGNIHQNTLKQRFQMNGSTLQAKALNAEEEAALIDDEGSAMKLKQKPLEMRKTGAKWNPDQWEKKQESVLRAYLQQRYERDEYFRKILEEIRSRKAKLVYYSPGQSDLGGSIQPDNSIEGKNIYGKLLMELVNLE